MRKRRTSHIIRRLAADEALAVPVATAADKVVVVTVAAAVTADNVDTATIARGTSLHRVPRETLSSYSAA